MHIGKGSWEKNDSKLLIHFYTEWRIILFIQNLKTKFLVIMLLENLTVSTWGLFVGLTY